MDKKILELILNEMRTNTLYKQAVESACVYYLHYIEITEENETKEKYLVRFSTLTTLLNENSTLIDYTKIIFFICRNRKSSEVFMDIEKVIKNTIEKL